MPKGPSTASQAAQLPHEPLEHKLSASTLRLLYAPEHIPINDVRTKL